MVGDGTWVISQPEHEQKDLLKLIQKLQESNNDVTVDPLVVVDRTGRSITFGE